MAIGLLITASQLKTTKVLGFPAERTWKLIKGSSRFANGVFFFGGREVGGCKHAETLRVILRPGIFLLFLILSDNAAQGGCLYFFWRKCVLPLAFCMFVAG